MSSECQIMVHAKQLTVIVKTGTERKFDLCGLNEKNKLFYFFMGASTQC
jgi:hypothetical protein